MKFNVKKCAIMQFTTSIKKRLYQYTMKDESLEIVHHYPYLGIELSDKLKYHLHINTISKKASSPSTSHSKTGVLKSIDIGCAGVDVHNNCKLKRGTNVSISTNFTSNVNTNKVTTVVHGILNGVAEVFLHLLSKDGEEGVRFNGVTEDACISNVDHCNITKGEIIQYTNTLPVDRKYPLSERFNTNTKQNNIKRYQTRERRDQRRDNTLKSDTETTPCIRQKERRKDTSRQNLNRK
ncbi:unnamed protein product [Mytilus coruscus]|uniref:MD-2-related lipid-recognition domain-containing protein n=1 Tax=Mytilus coruscus TaxID=42192 RepID=A0A6J8AZ57_MYTCO|nr:unnamed protein product [Mytilus coruscus]